MAALDHDKARDVGEYLEESSSIQAACPWYPPTNLSTFKHKMPKNAQHLWSHFYSDIIL